MFSYGEAYERMWLKGVEFTDRATRSEYWKPFLINLLVAILLWLLEYTITRAIVLLADLYALAAIVPGIALTIRRLHDTNRSGWWILVGLVPVLGTRLLIWFLAQPSSAATDRYGFLPADRAPG